MDQKIKTSAQPYAILCSPHSEFERCILGDHRSQFAGNYLHKMTSDVRSCATFENIETRAVGIKSSLRLPNCCVISLTSTMKNKKIIGVCLPVAALRKQTANRSKLCKIYGGIACVALLDPAMASDTDKARSAYPSYFTRPGAAGTDYNTWKGATKADVAETKVQVKRLPSRVDNSKRPQYPPIYEQKWGTCGQHAAIASVFTYEMNLLRGTNADSDATRFPAYFSWNMVNGAKDDGSEAYHGWEVAKRLGIPTSKSYGGVPPEKIGMWPNGYQIWRDAMEYHVAGYRYSPVTTVQQLDEARGWLFDKNCAVPDKNAVGGIFAMDGRMGEQEKITVKVPDGQYAAGEEIWTRWAPTGFGHGLTCVGYDDQVGYDYNGDGKITNDIDTNKDGKIDLADWERGCFIVANSWGAKWSGDGRIYLPYSAMTDKDWERGNYLGRVEVSHQIPRMTLRLKLACSDRSDLRVSIGMAKDPKATAPTSEIAPEVLNGWPLFGGLSTGRVPIAGPDDSEPIELGIDLTALAVECGRSAGNKREIFLRLGLAKDSKAEGKVYECAVRYYDAQGKFLRESMLAQHEGNIGTTELKISEVLN